MDFGLSDEQLAFQETARQFAREEWLPHVADWDEREEFPEAALRATAARQNEEGRSAAKCGI